MQIHDQFERPLRTLRVSVTDRCNLRCSYCMPEESYVWLERQDILRFEEISALIDCFIAAGVDRVRLTGGEPLLRRNLWELVRLLSGKPGLRDLALTTNGLLLAEQARGLLAAGLDRVTVSLDTLRPERFIELTRRDALAQVLDGIQAAHDAGFGGLKLDCVVIRGTNDDELADLIEYGKRVGAEVRFIEYMDVGGATRWSMSRVVSYREILARLRAEYGSVEQLCEETSAPAVRYRLPDGTVFGIISSTTAPFCRSCDRSRLTADGMWYLCLYARTGWNLRDALRRGESPEELIRRIVFGWTRRSDRGAEERLGLAKRKPLAPVDVLRADPHLEMHTRGG